MSTDFMPETPARTRILSFSAGIPGFPKAKEFSISSWGGANSPFVVLESVDIEGLHFVAVAPAVFFPWYTPEMPQEVLDLIGIEQSEDLTLLTILTLGETPAASTANLLGPVAINANTGAAVQAVLVGTSYQTKTPLISASPPA